MIRVDATQIPEWVAPRDSEVPRELRMKILLSPQVHSDLSGLGMGMTVYPPKTQNVLHTHSGSQETWYVVSGRGEMLAGTERCRLEPDTVVVVAAGIPHRIENVGDTELKVIWIFTPPGPETEFL